jgi:outer membrane receptor protein involved in Fe transport
MRNFFGFLADKWAPFQRLTLDLGLRFDRDSVTDSFKQRGAAGRLRAYVNPGSPGLGAKKTAATFKKQ